MGIEVEIKRRHAVTRTEYCGSCVYVGGKLKRLLFPGGYATPKAMGGGYEYHYYVTDYLGSVRAVVDEDGAVEEASSYYPYGMQMPDETGSIKQVQPYKYGGKERLAAAGVNLYDFGPRALYSPAAQFTSMDPKCEDYPHLSPYLYCAANPTNAIDPTGMDIWVLDTLGHIISHTPSDDTDEFRVMGGKDNETLINSISFTKGTIEENKKYTGSYSGGLFAEFDVYKVRGDKNSENLFTFLADNTSVEWSRAAFGVKDKGPSYIMSSHMEQREIGFAYMLEPQFFHKYYLRIFDHSHPNYPTPSGLKELEKDGTEINDIASFRLISEKFSEFGCNVIFRIYHDHKFYPYELPPKTKK